LEQVSISNQYFLNFWIFLLITSLVDSTFTSAQGFATFGAGLAVGLSCLASGIATGIVSRKMIPRVGDSRKKFVGFVLILVYCEAIGLYGLIVSLIAQSSGINISM